ncbi:MAG: LysR family transcriptional regulator [Dehalococcoidia bacterium]|jgi:molybdate transport system regulatory protein
MEPKINVWVEKDGTVVLSSYRVQLLQHIAEAGSLAAAARRMGLSSRRASSEVREMEASLGVRVVRSEVGGAGGGGTHLTPEGERIVALYPRFEASALADVRRRFVELFSEEM